MMARATQDEKKESLKTSLSLFFYHVYYFLVLLSWVACLKRKRDYTGPHLIWSAFISYENKREQKMEKDAKE